MNKIVFMIALVIIITIVIIIPLVQASPTYYYVNANYADSKATTYGDGSVKFSRSIFGDKVETIMSGYVNCTEAHAYVSWKGFNGNTKSKYDYKRQYVKVSVRGNMGVATDSTIHWVMGYSGSSYDGWRWLGR